MAFFHLAFFMIDEFVSGEQTIETAAVLYLFVECEGILLLMHFKVMHFVGKYIKWTPK